MKNKFILEKGDIIELENYATVIEDLGDKIKFFWNTDYILNNLILINKK